ncbi:hypothetical protein CDAR_40741 [Caerostris darwini]|uniref:Uncharacterized protein n=1 Tax=Caerostris darwini TaxID=1538125 RepID=A0AAV4T8B7_9ARAC|nr:hypothetical protein CDAR_40741 [Caerostris darwini]
MAIYVGVEERASSILSRRVESESCRFFKAECLELFFFLIPSVPSPSPAIVFLFEGDAESFGRNENGAVGRGFIFRLLSISVRYFHFTPQWELAFTLKVDSEPQCPAFPAPPQPVRRRCFPAAESFERNENGAVGSRALFLDCSPFLCGTSVGESIELLCHV